MKYEERACKFNMDTGCVELLLRDGRMISIDCTGVEDELDVTMAQRLELTEKIEADFYTQDVVDAKPQEPPENKTPVATKITGKMILEAIRQMDAEERRELTRVLFA